MRPDKKKVNDEIWDDARIDDFLAKAPLGADENPDFSAVLYAYRSMRAEDFARFIERFRGAGRDPHARGRDGKTVAEVIAAHGKAEPFLAILG